MVVRRRHLCRRHEVVVEPIELEHILRKLRQLPRPDHACLVHDVGRKHLRVAVLLRVEIHHKVDARAFKSCAEPLVEREACPRDLRRTLRIEHTEFLADVPMRLRLEIKSTRCPPTAHLRVLCIILADGYVRLRHVRDLEQQVTQTLLHPAQLLIECRDLITKRTHLSDHIIRALARLFAYTDLLRHGVATRLLLLHVLQNRTPTFIQCRKR